MAGKYNTKYKEIQRDVKWLQNITRNIKKFNMTSDSCYNTTQNIKNTV